MKRINTHVYYGSGVTLFDRCNAMVGEIPDHIVVSEIEYKVSNAHLVHDLLWFELNDQILDGVTSE